MGKGIRRQHTPEFKQEAVELVIKENYTITQAAKSLGINCSMLGRWKREYLSEMDPMLSTIPIRGVNSGVEIKGHRVVS